MPEEDPRSVASGYSASVPEGCGGTFPPCPCVAFLGIWPAFDAPTFGTLKTCRHDLPPRSVASGYSASAFCAAFLVVLLALRLRWVIFRSFS